MRSAGVVAVVVVAALAAIPSARAADPPPAPEATVSGSGIDVRATLGGGQEFCAQQALFADAGWPPLGLDTAAPATAGQTVRIAFARPVTLREAEVSGLAPPVISHPVTRMVPDGPTAWRVTLPAAPEPAGFALAFHGDWADGDCRGDQNYAVALGAPADVGQVTARAGGAPRIALHANAAVAVTATLHAQGLRLGRATASLTAGARRTLAVPLTAPAQRLVARHRRLRARLRLVIATADGGSTVVTHRVTLRAWPSSPGIL